MTMKLHGLINVVVGDRMIPIDLIGMPLNTFNSRGLQDLTRTFLKSIKSTDLGVCKTTWGATVIKLIIKQPLLDIQTNWIIFLTT